VRIGLGYDSHRCAPGRKLVLGGVHVPYAFGLLGHSDADVLTHAVIDALLGAAKLGDIGRLFSDSDPQFEGISSILLLEKVSVLLREAKYTVVNIDATIVAQAPRLADFIPEMEDRISNALCIDVSQVSVKAKTAEGMGFVGRKEGMEAHAVCLLKEKGEK